MKTSAVLMVGIPSLTIATKFSAMALAAALAFLSINGSVVAEYAVLLRVPLLITTLLLTLPILAFRTGAKSLLRGLFDLTPLSLFVVTLTTLAAAGMVCTTASIILQNGNLRFGTQAIPALAQLSPWVWLLIMSVISLPIIASSVGFSIKQSHGWSQCFLAALSGIIVAVLVVAAIILFNDRLVNLIYTVLQRIGLEDDLALHKEIFKGYFGMNAGADALKDQIRAFIAFGVTLFLYIGVGYYGWKQLGKRRTVPALCSALMLLLMIGWILSALTFFFDAWRIPLLLTLIVYGTLTAQSAASDHFYQLKKRNSISRAPDPVTTLNATKQSKVIVVAANGGGIQAGAWAAQVLYGLCKDCGKPFTDSLRMISSVSGGSVGSASFLYWLANPQKAREPDEAAAMSSLDEVAWGLSWPDLLRGLAPWIFAGKFGRGRALEQAWCLNSASDESTKGEMDKPLSDWNEKVARGELPSIIMNATIAESGKRLLLGTTSFTEQQKAVENARLDATTLHTINGKELDVGIVTAARLSATFPYVTPAARADAPKLMPHIVDGGYYDNYGMATLVEWLNEGLSDPANKVDSVLLIQIIGAPIGSASDEGSVKHRGWFYQTFAPLTTLAAVRSTGQIAHNYLELQFLINNLAQRQITLESVPFQFPGENAPLSWHLTPTEVKEIRDTWESDGMKVNRDAVKQFLGVAPAVMVASGKTRVEEGQV